MNEQETIADIIAEMRALSNPISDGIIAIEGRSIADRLEAAHKRERGDAAKLREALAYLFTLIDMRKLVLDCDETEEISAVQVMLDECRAALAATEKEGGAK